MQSQKFICDVSCRSDTNRQAGGGVGGVENRLSLSVITNKQEKRIKVASKESIT